MKTSDKVLLYGGVAVLGLVVIAYAAKKAGQGAAAVGSALNPVSDQNIFYKAANAVLNVFTQSGDTIGTWLYGVTHSYDPTAPAKPSNPAPSSSAPVPSSTTTDDVFPY